MISLDNYIINEGSWGYEPLQGDGPLDLRGDLFKDICELIYDKCEEYSKDTGCAWCAIGNIEHFFEEVTKMEGFKMDSKHPSDKYYYWFRLIDQKDKNIFELYNKLVDQCTNDEKWIEEWEDPDKIKKSLEKRKKISEKYAKLMEDYVQKESEAKLQQSTAQKQSEQQLPLKQI